MSFKGATINKLNGGLKRTSDSDRVVCLIMGMTPSENLSYNTAYELLDIKTAENLGITENTDDINGDLVHYHISEMFRLAPESTFWLIPVDRTRIVSDLLIDNEFKEAIRSIDNINVLGFAGLDTQAINALNDAVSFQALVNDFLNEYLYIDGIFVEGVGSSGLIAGTDYPDLRTVTAPNVSYVIAQDPAVAALKQEYMQYAAIGTVLGSVMVRKVHEDIGSVDIESKPRSRRGEENYSLSDEGTGYWLSASLSDGTPFKSLSSAEQKSLTAKGWMYVGSFAHYSGFYWNGCPTAVDSSSDYSYFNLNCIWNKAARLIRKTLIPRVRSKVPTDPDTGYIKSTWISGAESSISAKLDDMISDGNIEDKDVYINSAQSVDEDTPLEVKCQLVVGQIVHEFSVDLGLTNSL